MTRLPDQFIEDRALRDAAREVFMADIEHARTSISAKGVATRVGGRIGDGAKDVAEIARVQAEDHRGILAILIGAIVLWFARQPLLEILGLSEGAVDESGAISDEVKSAAGTGTETQSEPETQDASDDVKPAHPIGDDNE